MQCLLRVVGGFVVAVGAAGVRRGRAIPSEAEVDARVSTAGSERSNLSSVSRIT